MSLADRSFDSDETCVCGISNVDLSAGARHETWYVTAGSNRCRLADPQHVEIISGNGLQALEHHWIKSLYVQPIPKVRNVYPKRSDS